MAPLKKNMKTRALGPRKNARPPPIGEHDESLNKNGKNFGSTLLYPVAIQSQVATALLLKQKVKGTTLVEFIQGVLLAHPEYLDMHRRVGLTTPHSWHHFRARKMEMGDDPVTSVLMRKATVDLTPQESRDLTPVDVAVRLGEEFRQRLQTNHDMRTESERRRKLDTRPCPMANFITDEDAFWMLCFYLVQASRKFINMSNGCLAFEKADRLPYVQELADAMEQYRARTGGIAQHAAPSKANRRNSTAEPNAEVDEITAVKEERVVIDLCDSDDDVKEEEDAETEEREDMEMEEHVESAPSASAFSVTEGDATAKESDMSASQSGYDRELAVLEEEEKLQEIRVKKAKLLLRRDAAR